MKHLLILLFIVFAITVMAQDSNVMKDKILSNAEELTPLWDDYVKAVNNDSTLQVYWVYTGQEKPEYKTDSTIVKGVVSKVIVLQPTVKQEWVKKQPSFNGFKEYLKEHSK